ncbi:WD40 repeat domain-containing protein [Pseudoalteromonas sp. GB56]
MKPLSKRLILTLITLLHSALLIGCDGRTDVKQMTSNSSYRIVDASLISASLSEDSQLAAVLTSNQKINIWDINKKKQLQSWDFSEFDFEINQLVLSKDKQVLVVGGLWTVTVLSIQDGSVKYTWDVLGFEASATISALYASDRGNQILVGMTDGTVLSGDFSSGKALKLDHHSLMITKLAYTDDGEYAVSGSTDKNLAYWRTQDGQISYQHNFRSRITALILDEESHKMFVSDALQTNWILDKRNGNKLVELDFFEQFRFFRHGLFVEQGQYLFTTSPKDVVTMWNTTSGEEIVSWKIKRYTANATVISLAVNKEGNLVTLSSDGVVQTWNYQNYLN